MAKNLHHITQPLADYCAHRFAKQRAIRIATTPERITLPPALYAVFLEGEARLRLAFFAFMRRHFGTAPDAHMRYYDRLINPDYDRNGLTAITEMTERIGLHTLIKLHQQGHTYDYKCLNYHLYCLLIADIHAQPFLYRLATDAMFQHYVASFFPKAATPTLTATKQQINALLAEKLGAPIRLKERFHASDDTVEFAIHITGAAVANTRIYTEHGTRLKPTRLKAYQTLLKYLQQNTLVLPDFGDNKKP